LVPALRIVYFSFFSLRFFFRRDDIPLSRLSLVRIFLPSCRDAAKSRSFRTPSCRPNAVLPSLPLNTPQAYLISSECVIPPSLRFLVPLRAPPPRFTNAPEHADTVPVIALTRLGVSLPIPSQTPPDTLVGSILLLKLHEFSWAKGDGNT